MTTTGKSIIRNLPTLVVSTSLLAACTGSWVIRDVGDHVANEETQPSVIERLPTRQSPGIKTFRHYDLDIFRESPGRQYNDSYAVNQVRTPPGKVRIGVVFPEGKRVYNPEVEFNVVSGYRYQLTWICIPFPYVAVIDADSEVIVAIDSYCPGCEKLVGSTLPPDSECLIHMQPPWLEPYGTSPWVSKWSLWNQESLYQNYRDLCFAAEHGLVAAMMNLAFEFEHGFSAIQKDHVRAYVWYRLARNAGYDPAITDVERMEKTHLSAEQLDEAENLILTRSLGQCENDIEILRSHEPVHNIQIGD